MRNLTLKAALVSLLIWGGVNAQAGVVMRVFYDEIEGDTVQSLVDADHFPNGPNPTIGALFTELLTEGLDTGPDTDAGVDNFGTHIRGFIEIPEDGDYQFFLASDDPSQLWMADPSTPSDIGSTNLVAFETGCCTEVFAGDRLEERSSDPMTLSKGDKIYFETLHKEIGGDEFVSVGWQKPDGTQEIVPGERLSPLPLDGDMNVRTGVAPTILDNYKGEFLDPSGQPQSVTVVETEPAKFVVTYEATQPVSIQWMRNGSPIDGATLASYSIPETSLADSGDTFSVEITNDAGSVTSSTANLTVNPDSTAPVVERVDHRGNPNGLRVTYSELVSEATATDVGNYELDGGDLTIDSAELLDNGREVQLSGTWNFAIDSTHTLVISDVEDLASTPNAIDPNPSTHEITFAGGEGTLFDFNDGVPEGLELFGTAEVRGSGSYDGSGFLSVNDGEGSQAGAALFTERRTVDQIKFEFKARIGDTSADPADGFSFNVADDLPEGVYPQSEEGYNAGTDSVDGQGLMVAFDNWDSGATDNSPSITVKYDGEVKGNAMTGQDGIPAIHQGDRWIDVSIDLQLNGTITVIYDGVTVFDQLDIGFTGLEDAQVGFGGRTGGAWESHWFDDLTINFQGGEVGPVEIAAEGQPQSVEVDENTTATFEVEAGGAGPFSYQWRVNGEPIEGATTRAYTTSEVSPDMDGNEYTVVVSNEFSSATSDPAVLTVIEDTTVPEIASVEATEPTRTTVDVVFNERVTAESAENIDNYSVDGGLSVTGATLQSDQMTVVLNTSEQAQGTTYTLTVDGVSDIAAAANTISGAEGSWISWVEVEGVVARYMYFHTGNFVVDRYTVPGDFPDGAEPFGDDPAQDSTLESILESPRDVTDNYGAILSGWVTPPESGDYTFYVASDDNSQLYLSTDDDPANATQIASEPSWNAYRDWTGTTRRNADDPENVSDPQTLEAGQRYYIEAVFNEGGGGDGMEVAWVGPSDPAIANEDPSIAGEHLSTAIPGKHSPTVVAQVPADGTIDTGNFDAIELTVEDGNTGVSPVDPDSVVMTLNGEEVTPTVTRNTDGLFPTTTIQYADPDLENMTSYDVQITLNYGDNEQTYSWSYQTDVDVDSTFVEGTRFIEAEDWNYDSGQWVEGGNGGPTGDTYTGGAYQDLVGTPDVDYNDEGGGGGDPLYRYAPGTDPAAQPGPATVDFGFVDRGSFEVESNWKVGWTAPGQWMNYTRDFPEEETTYDVYANISSGGEDPNPTLELVTSDPTQPDQTVEQLGEFSGAASGDWATAIFYKMHAPGDPDAPGQVTLSGVNTLRLTIGGQMDVNYLAFVPAEPVQPAPDISVSLDDSGNITLQWTGTLYSAPEVTGPYSEVTDATSPMQVSPDEAQQYYKSGN